MTVAASPENLPNSRFPQRPHHPPHMRFRNLGDQLLSSKKRRSTTTETSQPARFPTPHATIAYRICIAATLISVPGTFLYLAVIGWIYGAGVSLAGNLIAPLLLASMGLALCLIAIFGLATGIWHLMEHRTLDRLGMLCLWLNGMALAGMMALAAFAPQLG